MFVLLFPPSSFRVAFLRLKTKKNVKKFLLFGIIYVCLKFKFYSHLHRSDFLFFLVKIKRGLRFLAKGCRRKIRARTDRRIEKSLVREMLKKRSTHSYVDKEYVAKLHREKVFTSDFKKFKRYFLVTGQTRGFLYFLKSNFSLFFY